MPIKPENKHLYPSARQWAKIRASILARAGHVCETCGVPNHRYGARNVRGKWLDVAVIDGMNSTEGDQNFADGYPKIIRIVLTISHQDHDPANNDPANLKALCQACHLGHDRALHTRNAARTRLQKRDQAIAATGQLTLTGE